MTASSLDVDAVKAAIADVRDPETGTPLLESGQLPEVDVTDRGVSVTMKLSTWAKPIADEVEQELVSKIRVLHSDVDVVVQHEVLDRRPQPVGEIGLTAKSVVAVGSGKGGVGKSTIAVDMALGLKRLGARVGILDADVYGPSVPHLLGTNQRPTIVDNRIEPVHVDGIPVMSMGSLVPRDEPVVWRGPMLHGTITQFLRDTMWGDLDYLIIDMPPGTGDVALTLSQLLPLTGAVVVCTPQEVALLDAVKAIAMFRKVQIRVLGMVENMSGFICPDCNRRYDIFGRGGARREADRLGIPLLGDVPITIKHRELGDAGQIATTFDDPHLAEPLEHICRELVRQLAAVAASNAPSQLPTL